MSDTVELTRRERLRAQTLAEIKEHALAQLAQGGPDALSLNAISRAMRMSGPALYRYFASRDELLAVLVVEAYDELGEALETASVTAAPGGAADRFRAVAGAYRKWAKANQHRYQLIFASRWGSGLHAPQRTIPAAHRSMSAVLGAVTALASAGGIGADAAAAANAQLPTQPSDRPAGQPDGELRGQLQDWADSRADQADVPPAVLHLGVLSWTRLHGLVSLEIAGTFTAMQIDPDLLYSAEVEQLITQTTEAPDTAAIRT